MNPLTEPPVPPLLEPTLPQPVRRDPRRHFPFCELLQALVVHLPLANERTSPTSACLRSSKACLCKAAEDSPASASPSNSSSWPSLRSSSSRLSLRMNDSSSARRARPRSSSGAARAPPDGPACAPRLAPPVGRSATGLPSRRDAPPAQILQAPSGFGSEDGSKGRFRRFAGPLGAGGGLARQDLGRHLVNALVLSHGLPLPEDVRAGKPPLLPRAGYHQPVR
jgi:hypothetical protein